MVKTQAPPDRPGNALLARLPADEYRALLPHLRLVPLPIGKVLHKAYAPIDYVYFPQDGVVSAMTVMEDGSAIEVATVGKEGMVGLMVFMGGDTSPNEVMVQVEGNALRMPAETFRETARENGPLRQVLALYHIAFQTQISYAVACNGLHTLHKRCCRWLLMTQDRVGSDELPLTHEFLATMLGVRRSSVTEVLQPLQEQGLIRNLRGKIIVADRPGLEAGACECYHRVREEFNRLLP